MTGRNQPEPRFPRPGSPGPVDDGPSAQDGGESVPSSRARRARRGFLRAVFGLGAVAATGAALTPLLRAGHPEAAAVPGGRDTATDGKGSDGASGGGPAGEMYRGRLIQIGGGPPGGGAAAPASSGTAARAGSALSSPVDIRIDGRPLHVMRRADGSYLSSVNHYESFPTPLEVARAAVDDLGGARLSLSEPIHHV